MKYDFSQIDRLKEKLDAFRPLDADLYQKIRKKFHLEWTYHSNAIEGNTLTLSETRFYLSEGLTSKGHSLSEYLETKNHAFALEYLEEIVREKTPLSERIIKELHSMLFVNNDTITIENELGQKITKSVLPGQYKKEKNYVLLPDGSQKWHCDPLQVQTEIEKLVTFYGENKEKMHPIELAVKLHAEFVHIHPFVDGNGRVARLIMNIIIMQAGYSPAIIPQQNRQEYFSYLQKYDETGEIEDLVFLIEEETTKTMKIMLNAAEGKFVFEPKDVQKRISHFGKAMESLDKDIGKVSKKVSRQSKEESVRSIRNYLSQIAKTYTF